MTTRTRWQLGMVLLTAAPRLAAAAMTAPFIGPDSERYRNDAEQLDTFRFWDGRGPGVLTQLIHLLPLSAAVLLQTVLVIALWGAAALFAASIASDRHSWPTFLVIHLWGLSPWFSMWDSWVLTEGLTAAGCALAAVGTAAVRTRAPGGAWVTLIGLAVAVAARPFAGAVLLPLVAAALLWPLSRTRLRQMTAPLAATAAIGAFAAWNVVAFATTPSAPFSYLPEPESMAQIQATDRFAGRGHLPGYLDLARDADMPRCSEAEALAVAPLTENQKIAQLREIDDCPAFDQWLADGGLPWTHEFTQNAQTTFGELTRSSYWIDGTFAFYIAANDRISQLEERAPTAYRTAVRIVNSTMLLATAAASLMILLLGRGQRLFFALSLAVAGTVSLYVWGADGIEYWRHLLPAFAVLLPLAVTLGAAGQHRVSYDDRRRAE